jgi:hypothetical protein
MAASIKNEINPVCIAEALARMRIDETRTGRGIDRETLRSAFREELDRGRAIASQAVANALYNNAVVNGNVTAQIWWTKARLGWKETVQQKFLDQDGNPVGPVLNVYYGRPEPLPAPETVDGTQH